MLIISEQKKDLRFASIRHWVYSLELRRHDGRVLPQRKPQQIQNNGSPEVS